MLNINLNQESGIAVLEPDGELTAEDFISAAQIIDTHIEQTGILNGIIIHAKTFPGWDSFSALTSHLTFIKEHHKKISCVAFSTDSPIVKLAETVASHFVAAKIKTFPFSEIDNAKLWITETSSS